LRYLLIVGCPFFSFHETATTEIYTLSLHDALPISWPKSSDSIRVSGIAAQLTEIINWLARLLSSWRARATSSLPVPVSPWISTRSEEHTSELQSRENLVCRLLLEKKKVTENVIALT